jgi:pimeloyl-ACP methyl ester carboxylesterase
VAPDASGRGGDQPARWGRRVPGDERSLAVRPEDVAIPVHIFHGSADALVPEAWGRELARRIPGAAITLYPDGGHFIALTRRREVLEYLVDSPP